MDKQNQTEQKLLPDYQAWRNFLWRMNYIVFVLIVLLENLIFFVLYKSDLILQTMQVYICKYYATPIASSLFVLLLGHGISKIYKKNEKLINALPILTAATMIAIISIIHCTFSVLTLSYCFPIMMTIIFSDKKLCIITCFYSQFNILLFMQYKLHHKELYNDPYILSSTLIVCMILFVMTYISLVIIDQLNKQNTKLFLSTQKLKEAEWKAQQANQAKSAFLSNMSHEIRTPMNAIIGMTDVLLQEEHSQKDMEYLSTIKNSGQALITIINDILDFSKIEAGKMELIDSEYDLLSVLKDLSMIFWNRIGDKDIELIYDIDKNVPSLLYGDSLRLRQIIINLVNNAIKYTNHGTVELNVKVKSIINGQVELSFNVIDTGTGIEKKELDHLFTSFQQFDTTRNHKKEGTGLGLAISKQLVELMGGTISAKSEYQKGSEFSFTIRQRLIDSTPAVTIPLNTAKEITICVDSDNEHLIQSVEKLATTYKVKLIPFIDESSSKKIDYLFTDTMTYEYIYKNMDQQQLNNLVANVCVLQNPMHEVTHDNTIISVKKPLYSYNFAKIIKQESLHNTDLTPETTDTSFKAPNAKILIVDDNEINICVALAILKPLQMQIDIAENGKAAIEKIKSKEYDLVLMDHLMPIMDGIEATKIIRANHDIYYQQLPIIALSANAMSDAKVNFQAAGMNDFIAKPIDANELQSKIKKWLPTCKLLTIAS